MTNTKKNWKLPKLETEVWLEALRSGEYKQGETHLFQEKDGVKYYCCLGVFCELNYSHKKDWRNDSFILQSSVGSEVPDELCHIPEVSYDGHKLYRLLAAMNDGAMSVVEYFNGNFKSNLKITKYSFEEIADFIEQNVELV